MDHTGVTWRKASHSGSNGGCVEVGADWRKASYSGSNGACVEVGAAARAIAVRDSKDPDGPRLVFTPADWQTFTRRVKAGEHDLT